VFGDAESFISLWSDHNDPHVNDNRMMPEMADAVPAPMYINITENR
jgi:hypothetical protein